MSREDTLDGALSSAPAGSGRAGSVGLPGSMLACRADFPRHLFTIDSRPEAMRASAEGYRSVAARAAEWDSRLTQATAASWVGTEGDTFRRARGAYHPMLRAAQEAFTGLHREIDRCATSIDYAIRRMDVVRPAAEDAWYRLQEARAAADALAAGLDARSGTHLFSGVGDTPQVAALRRSYDLLAEEAATLRRRVGEAAAEAVTAIGRLTPPAAVPQPGGDPYGPTVVSRDTYEVEGTAKYELVKGGVRYQVEQVHLSDGRWCTRLTQLASLAADGTWQPVSVKVGGKDLDGLPEAGASAETAGGFVSVWYSDTREEGDGKALMALAGILTTRTPQGVVMWSRPDAQGFTRRVTLAAETSCDPGAAVRPSSPLTTGEEVGAIGGKISGSVEVRQEYARNGGRETTIAITGSGMVEHPWFDEKGVPAQKTYGGTRGLTATVRTGPNGQKMLIAHAVVQKEGDPQRYERQWTRFLTPEEGRRFEDGAAQIARAGGVGGSDVRASVALVQETASMTKDSPLVRDGTVDISERTYEVETTAHPSLEGQLLGVGAAGGVEVTSEKLVEERHAR